MLMLVTVMTEVKGKTHAQEVFGLIFQDEESNSFLEEDVSEQEDNMKKPLTTAALMMTLRKRRKQQGRTTIPTKEEWTTLTKQQACAAPKGELPTGQTRYSTVLLENPPTVPLSYGMR